MSKLKKAKKEYLDTHGEKATDSDLERILTSEIENPVSESVFKAIMFAYKNKNTLSLDNTFTFDEDGEEISMLNMLEDKNEQTSRQTQEIKWAFDDEIAKIKQNSKKGNLIAQILEFKIEGYNSSEIQHKMGISRSTERTLERKGIDFLRSSDKLRDLTYAYCL